MASKSKTAAAPRPKAATAEERELQISIEKLRRSCEKMYGISLSTFDGATAHLSGEKYSVKEMQKIIDDFLSQEVK